MRRGACCGGFLLGRITGRGHRLDIEWFGDTSLDYSIAGMEGLRSDAHIFVD